MQKYLNIYIFEKFRFISLSLQLSDLVIHCATILFFCFKKRRYYYYKKVKVLFGLKEINLFCQPKI